MNRFQSAIKNALSESISDIYITGAHSMVTRKEGKIRFHYNIKWSHQEVDALVRKLLPPKQLVQLQERKSVDHALTVSNARLRINIFTTTRGLSLAIRILPGHIPTIDLLNLHPSLHEIAHLNSGLILTCGGTGVGKTSTIAAIIDDINRTRPAHIITLENPIEYRFQSNKSFIQQRELGTHMPSFAQGLIDVLRENPDIIVVGELREQETMQMALNAAESGHLVIATMHASSPEEAVYRLCNTVALDAQNEIRYQIASTLNWLIVQQLVYLEKVKLRVPLLTIVRGTSSIKALIRDNKLNQMSSAIQTGKGDGMFTAERYKHEYLNLKPNFSSPEDIFRPSLEASREIIYHSPLVEAGNEALPLKKKTGKIEDDRILRSKEVITDDIENTIPVDKEDISIQDLIQQLSAKQP